MNPIKLVGAILVVGGILALAYGGFSYNRNSTVVKVGSLELTAQERHTVNVPLWAGIAAVAAGVLLFAAGGRKS